MITRNKQYKYSKEIINKIYFNYRPKYSFNPDYSLVGGSIEKTNEILKEYSGLNLEVDIMDSTNDEVRIMLFNLNKSITCAGLVLNYENKVAEIIDLRSDSSCIRTNEKVLPKILNVLIGICKSSGMKEILMSDMSYHRCNDPKYSIKLDIGNILTDGEPYYYKYGFKYENEINQKAVVNNKEKLLKAKTKNMKWDSLEKMIRKDIVYYRLNVDIDKSVNEIKNIYNEYINRNVKEFLKKIKYEMCEVFSVIYKTIYTRIGLLQLMEDHIMTYKIE